LRPFPEIWRALNLTSCDIIASHAVLTFESIALNY
jgi:hypothetical protein